MQSITDFFVGIYQDEGFIFKQSNQAIEGEDYLLYHFKSDAEKMEFILGLMLNPNVKNTQVLGEDQEIAGRNYRKYY